MKQYTSEAAKSLITIIGSEYLMAESRVARGFIKRDQMLGTLLERLNRLAIDNVNLRNFLDNGGHIPVIEDEGMDYKWAEDPRDPRDIEVAGERDQQTRDPKNKTMRARFGSRSNVLTGR